MKKYLLAMEIKPEFEKEYIDIHHNPWREMLEAIKEAGYTKEALFWFKGYSLIYLECPDDTTHEECDARLRATDVCKKWDITVSPWCAAAPITCEKIFDLEQQLEGELKAD